MRNFLQKRAEYKFPIEQFRALCVHIFTAIGAVFAMLALVAAGEGNFLLMYAWLGCALFIDGMDGFFARKANVKLFLPRFSGEVLDVVIDYITYVFVPAYFVYISNVVPDGWSLFAASVICFTSLYCFADAKSKTEDHYFSGFPVLWNVVIFYILLLSMNQTIALGIIVIFSCLVFVPIKFIHPGRVIKNRPFNLLVTAIWFVLFATALYDTTKAYNIGIIDPTVPVIYTSDFVTIGLCLTIVYALVIGIIRTIKGIDVAE